MNKIVILEQIKNILEIYINKYYNELDDKDTWFNKIKELCDELIWLNDGVLMEIVEPEVVIPKYEEFMRNDR